MEKTEKAKKETDKEKRTKAGKAASQAESITDNDTTFETAMDRLEKIVRQMENGEATLEESLTLFEEGIGLVKLCNKKLDDAEHRVSILTEGPDGKMTEQPFSPENG